MKKIVIAIDGPSAAGKSSVAKIVANKLSYNYLDTGAMYRCVALFLKQKFIDTNDIDAICGALSEISIKLDSNKVYLNGSDVSELIRHDEISMMTSVVSSHLCVREFLVEQQRELSKDGGVVLDGRDIGTVVLPHADLKIYQIASVATRAKRRFDENTKRGLESNLDDITKDIEQRDYQDSNRKESPLKKAEDAIELDTSFMTLDEVVNEIMNLVNIERGV